MAKQNQMAQLGEIIANDIKAIGVDNARNQRIIDDMYEYAIANDNADGMPADDRLLMFEWHKILRKICTIFDDKNLRSLQANTENV